MTTRTIRSLGIERPGQARFFSYDEEPPGPGQFRVDTLYTGLSAGTELTFFKGTNPYLTAAWDDGLGLFDRRPGQEGATFPIRFLGYMEVGVVTESRLDGVDAGATVAMSYGHKSGHTGDATSFLVPVPADLDPVLGVYLAQLGPICANGLLHAAADRRGAAVQDLGDGVRDRRVLVTGAGLIGLFTALFAAEHGAAEVVVADASPARRRAVAALGLMALDDAAIDVGRELKERWHHGDHDRGADVVFQCRGQSSALHTALRALRPQGTVIDLAFYQGGADGLRLGEEFHHNGLTIRCAQIARVPSGLADRWDRTQLAEATIALLRRRGRDIRAHVMTDVVAFDDGPALFADLAARRRDTLSAVFAVPPP